MWEEEEGGRKGRAPLERGHRPRHHLPLTSQGAGSTSTGEPKPGVSQHQPGHSPQWGLHLHFLGSSSSSPSPFLAK